MKDMDRDQDRKYLKILVEDIHTATVATIASDGWPQTRVIDMMLYDEQGVYFLTARGKAFYEQLMEQKHIALSAAKDKRAISLRGKVKNIGAEKRYEIFERNSYMKEIYPGDTSAVLEVFCLYEARGEYFDLSDPAHIFRAEIVIGKHLEKDFPRSGYRVLEQCSGCGACLPVCPQRCIAIQAGKAVIDFCHCLHCGLCAETCPEQAIIRSENQKEAGAEGKKEGERR